MFAASGLLTSAALQVTASADVGASQSTRILAPDPQDLAPVTGNPPRLRRTDQEQPGKEMMHVALFGDGKSGLAVMMSSGALPSGQKPPVGREQCAVIPFSLTQNTDGTVAATADPLKAKYFTANRANENRACNHPSMTTIAGGNAVFVEYNWQPQNTNDTKRYAMVFDKAGNVIMPQTEIYHKNNDDCQMAQDTSSTTLVADGTTNRLISWAGCNGNGQDDGWMHSFTVSCDSATNPTQCSYKNAFDISLAQREERSRGLCTVGTDPNTAICSWTEGNTQPQRDGVWMAAVDITPGAHQGTDQGALLWKTMVDGKNTLPSGKKVYSMRMKQERVLAPDATGKLVPTDDVIVQYGELNGNNNNNNGKGGTYYRNMMGVATATRAGLTWKLKPVDMQSSLVGLDGTHLGMSFAMFGTTDKLQPGITFLAGNQTGGVASGQLRNVVYDSTANAFKDLGSYAIAPYDRHLYSNYLGNNPGNQGRNFSHVQLVQNPFVGQNGNKDAYLLLSATTGKDPADAMNPALKLSAYISVTPVATLPTTGGNPPPGNGSGSGSGSAGNTGSGSGSSGGSGSGSNPSPNPDPGASDPGSTMGGCSAGGSSSGAATLFLIGLAAFIRRRR